MAFIAASNSPCAASVDGKTGASGLRTAAHYSKNMHDDFYNDERILRGAFRRLDSASMSPSNKSAVREFATTLEAEGLSRLRIAKYVYHLKVLDIFCDPQPT